MGSHSDFRAWLRCVWSGHDWNYSIMYKHPRVAPHVVHEKACERCHRSVPRFLGPTVEQLEEAGITDIPNRKRAYEMEGFV